MAADDEGESIIVRGVSPRMFKLSRKAAMAELDAKA